MSDESLNIDAELAEANAIAEKATDDVTAADDKATPDPAADPTSDTTPEEKATDQQPEPEGGDEVSTEDLLGEIREKGETEAPKASDEQRDKDRQARAEKFELQFQNWSNRVTKFLNENTDKTIDDAVTELNIPANIAGKLQKFADEPAEFEEDPVEKLDHKAELRKAAAELKAEERAETILSEAIVANKLNINSPDAVAMRQKIVAEYRRYAATLSPDEAAEIAVLRSGLKDKTIYKKAFEAGQRDKNAAKPTSGEAGKPPSNPSEITDKNIGNLSVEQITALNKKAMGVKVNQ